MEVVKIKTIVLMIFLCSLLAGFFSSCFPDHLETDQESDTEEHYLLDKDEDEEYSLFESEGKSETRQKLQQLQKENDRDVEQFIETVRSTEEQSAGVIKSPEEKEQIRRRILRALEELWSKENK